MQQCSACNLDVELCRSTVPQLCSFAAWLPAHAALLKSITAKADDYEDLDTVEVVPAQQYMAVAHQLLQPALRLARLLPAEAAAAAAAVDGSASCAGPVTGPQQQPGLQLQRFYSNWPRSAAMLADLPAQSLTALDLDFQLSIGVDGSSLSALLARLSSLQQLRLSTVGYDIRVPVSCLAGIAGLRQLTELVLEGYWDEKVEQPLQQLFAQPLPLRRLKLRLPLVSLSSLTRLEEFETDCIVHDGAVLPAQLQRLRLPYLESTGAITALQQLQELRLGVEFQDRAELLRLAQLPSLRHVALRYKHVAYAAETAAAWQHLPQLQELFIRFEYDGPDEQEMGDILAGLAACTQLTKLDLPLAVYVDGPAHDEGDGEFFFSELQPVAACASLARLTGLRHLAAPVACIVPGDALALTALIGLTHLRLGAESGVDDVVASALACSLKQLRHLDLSSCELGSMACMAAIGHLSQLTALKLIRVAGVTERGLMLLTRLSAMQCLEVTKNAEVTNEVLGRFWAAVRQQRR